MGNRQHQALVSSYFTTNVTLTGGGTIDGNGWCVARLAGAATGGRAQLAGVATAMLQQ